MRDIFFTILAAVVLAIALLLTYPEEKIIGTYNGVIVEFVPRQGKFRNGPELVIVKLPNGNVVTANIWVSSGALLPSGTAVQIQERSGSWFVRHSYWVQTVSGTPVGP